MGYNDIFKKPKQLQVREAVFLASFFLFSLNLKNTNPRQSTIQNPQ
jgi:hypothetical protein